MKCPKCGMDGRSSVIRTLKCADGVIRWRLCGECNRVSSSTEAFDEESVQNLSTTSKQTDILLNSAI